MVFSVQKNWQKPRKKNTKPSRTSTSELNRRTRFRDSKLSIKRFHSTNSHPNTTCSPQKPPKSSLWHTKSNISTAKPISTKIFRHHTVNHSRIPQASSIHPTPVPTTPKTPKNPTPNTKPSTPCPPRPKFSRSPKTNITPSVQSCYPEAGSRTRIITHLSST